MSEEYKKQRYSVWLSKDAVQKSDAAVVMEGLTNRSDFIEKAIHFYSGYLYQEKHMDFLSDDGNCIWHYENFRKQTVKDAFQNRSGDGKAGKYACRYQ